MTKAAVTGTQAEHQRKLRLWALAWEFVGPSHDPWPLYVKWCQAMEEEERPRG